MHCPRCSRKMIESTHQEHEQLGECIRIKHVSTRECGTCSVFIQAIIPSVFRDGVLILMG
jgi:hypothetical protein